MRKFILFLICFLVFAPVVSIAKAAEIPNVGFVNNRPKLLGNDLKSFFCNYVNYANQHNLDALMNLYADDYKSSDDFGKEKLKDLAKDAWNAFPDAKYSFKILHIDAGFENAIVIAEEEIKGETVSNLDYIKGNGLIVSDAVTVYNLKKVSGEWKIIKDTIIDERTSLRYGAAKNISIVLDAPNFIKPGSEYTVGLKVNAPKGCLSLISLNNEPIVYPPEKSKEVFRTLKSNDIQERILKVNEEGRNENAIASIGIAKAKITPQKDINIKVIGIAFFTSRVNIIKDNIERNTDK